MEKTGLPATRSSCFSEDESARRKLKLHTTDDDSSDEETSITDPPTKTPSKARPSRSQSAVGKSTRKDNPKRSSSRHSRSSRSRSSHRSAVSSPQLEFAFTPLPLEATGIIEVARKQLQQIINDPLPPEEAKKKIKTVRTSLRKIRDIEEGWRRKLSTQEATIEELRKRVQDHKDIIKDILPRVASPQIIQQAVEDSMKTYKNNLNEVITTAKTLLNTLKEAGPPAQYQPQSSSKQLTNDSYSAAAQDATKRTLIIKSRDSSLTGDAVLEKLKQINFAIPRKAFENVLPKRNFVELCCQSKEDREALKQDFSGNPSMNNFDILDKLERKQKIIIIGAPPDLDEEFIKSTLQSILELKDDDILAMRQLRSRTDKQNWTALLPFRAATNLINQGGFCLGLHRVLVRPHTTVQRCTRCQAYGHSKGSCVKEESCANCAQNHVDPQCKEAPKCINCHRDNKYKQKSEWIATNHPAYSSTCPAYRKLYAKERQRLDSIFPPTKRETKAEPPRQQRNQISNKSNFPPGHPQQTPPPFFGLFPPQGFFGPPPGYFHQQAYLPPAQYENQSYQDDPHNGSSSRNQGNQAWNPKSRGQTRNRRRGNFNNNY